MVLPEARFWIVSGLPTTPELARRMLAGPRVRQNEVGSTQKPKIDAHFQLTHNSRIRRGRKKPPRRILGCLQTLVCSSAGSASFFLRDHGAFCSRFDDMSDHLWLGHIHSVATFNLNDGSTGSL